MASSGGAQTRGITTERDEGPTSRKFRRSRRCLGLSAVLALSYRRRHNSAGEALLFPFLLKLSPSPTSSLPFNHSSPLPKWPPLLALSAPSPPRPLPRSLSLPPAALRLLSASRGEPGASPRAHLVSYSVPPSWQSESPERFCRRIGYVEISYMPC